MNREGTLGQKRATPGGVGECCLMFPLGGNSISQGLGTSDNGSHRLHSLSLVIYMGCSTEAAA